MRGVAEERASRSRSGKARKQDGGRKGGQITHIQPRTPTANTCIHPGTQLGQMRLEKQNIPSAARSRVNQRFRNYETDADRYKRKLKTLSDDRAALFGGRYTDDPARQNGRHGDAQQEQRQQLLSGTDRLDRSTQRLRNSQALANETESIGASTLANLHEQRERIAHTTMVLGESEGYVDRSVKTLRGMARRYCSPLGPVPSPSSSSSSSSRLTDHPVAGWLRIA